MKKRIYIVSPNNKTGGVECLHQLCEILNKHKIDAGIFYLESPKEKLYPQYEYKVFDRIVDVEKNSIVVPEIYPDFLDNYSRAKKYIWWLSYYNAPLERYLYKITGVISILNKVFRKFFPKKHKKATMFLFENKKRIQRKFYKINHLCQSNYVFKKLKRKKLQNLFMLEDYVLIQNPSNNIKKKEDIIAYNPKKGMEYTKKIIKSNPELTFLPLINMTKEELYSSLEKSKIYIDFGNHPGRDKIPREAVLKDCLVVTNFSGSARNHGDVPSPYKFNEKKDSLKKVSRILGQLIKNYKQEIKKYSNYKKIVLTDKEKMENQALRIFKNETPKSIHSHNKL